jgi:hypothetical protein
MAPKAVFHDLALLLHSVRAERFSGLQSVVVRTGAEADRPIKQIPQLGNETASEIPPESPGLKLGTMGKLMRQDRQMFLTLIWKKNPVAQRHCSIPAEPQHDSAKTAGPATGAGTVEADALIVDQGD